MEEFQKTTYNFLFKTGLAIFEVFWMDYAKENNWIKGFFPSIRNTCLRNLNLIKGSVSKEEDLWNLGIFIWKNERNFLCLKAHIIFPPNYQIKEGNVFMRIGGEQHTGSVPLHYHQTNQQSLILTETSGENWVMKNTQIYVYAFFSFIAFFQKKEWR